MVQAICIRRFEKKDAQTVADLVRKTLEISNSKDYPPEYIKENIESHSAQVIEDRANESHFYVSVDGDTIIGCGGITGYWGSTTESYLVTIFVLPEYQHKNNVTTPDEFGVVRLEKITGERPDEV